MALGGQETTGVWGDNDEPIVTSTAANESMTPTTSASLLEELFVHATRKAFTCRFRWQPRSVAMWDNRCVQHYAPHDCKGRRLHMRRISICGDRLR